MRFAVLLFAGIAMMASSVAALDLNPPRTTLSSRVPHEISSRQLTSLTNAKRLAAGLPLKRPTRRHHPETPHPRPSGLPGVTACISVTNSDDSSPMGWVSSSLNVFGESKITGDESARLRVRGQLRELQDGSANLQILTAPVDHHKLGGITGFSEKDVKYSYAYLGYVEETAPGAPAQPQGNSFSDKTGKATTVESAIWKIDPSTRKLSAFWINSDGHEVAAFILYSAKDDCFVIVADKDAFFADFGHMPTVTLTLVDA